MEPRFLIIIFVCLWSWPMNVTLGENSTSILNGTDLVSSSTNESTILTSTAATASQTHQSVSPPTAEATILTSTVVAASLTHQSVSPPTAESTILTSTVATASLTHQSVSPPTTTSMIVTSTVVEESTTQSGISSIQNKQNQSRRYTMATSNPNYSTTTISVVYASSRNLSQNTIFPSSTSDPFPASSSATYVISSKPKPLIIAFSLIFDQNFNADLKDKESLAYLMKQSEVLKILNIAYENETEFLLANVNGCERNDQKIRCNGRLYFNNSKSNVTELSQILNSFLQQSNYNASVAEFKLTDKEQPDKVDDDDDDDDDVVLGLNWWQIGIIIAGLVILILLIAVICLHTKLQKMKKNNSMENLMYGNQLFGDDENGEMKTLRASPPKLEDDLTIEPNHNTIYMDSFSSASPKKDDRLVKETEVKIGVGNETSGDVIKL